LAATGLVFLFFAIGILVAFYCAQVAATGYRMHKLENDLSMLRKETHGLHSDIARLSSLDRVEAVAVSRLGMVKPEPNQVVMVKTDLAAAEAMATNNTGREAGAVEGTAPPAAGEQAAGEAGAGEGRNWVIQAFVNLVGQLEYRLRPG
jgi:cell division protein FtsL